MADPRLASASLHADVARLRAQATLSWPSEFNALRQHGLQDGMSILDVGSGPGVVADMLLRDLPNARVTALELDPTMCAIAHDQLSQRDPRRYEIVESSVLLTNLPDEQFDFALARFVFQHLPAPDLAATEILRLLKPKGQLAILDVDDELGGIVLPQQPAFATLARRVRDTQFRRGGNRHIARELWQLLRQVGFADVELSAVLIHSDELGLDAFRPQFDPQRYRPFVDSGGLTEDEWRAYGEAYEQLFASPDAYILQLILLASAAKPAHD